MYNITKLPIGQSVQLPDNHLIYIWECLKNIKEKTSLYQSYTNRIAVYLVHNLQLEIKIIIIIWTGVHNLELEILDNNLCRLQQKNEVQRLDQPSQEDLDRAFPILYSA